MGKIFLTIHQNKSKPLMITFLRKQALLTGIGIYTLLISNFPTLSCPPPSKFTVPNSQNTTINNSMTSKIQTFQGLLTYQPLPPGRSVRGYKGEEFFLTTNSVEKQTIVLRPSEKVAAEDLESFHNQQVKITAVYFAGTRPPVDKVACPLDLDRRCMVQGEGYRVLSIAPLP
jgi:hypothetical protein